MAGDVDGTIAELVHAHQARPQSLHLPPSQPLNRERPNQALCPIRTDHFSQDHQRPTDWQNKGLRVCFLHQRVECLWCDQNYEWISSLG